MYIDLILRLLLDWRLLIILNDGMNPMILGEKCRLLTRINNQICIEYIYFYILKFRRMPKDNADILSTLNEIKLIIRDILYKKRLTQIYVSIRSDTHSWTNHILLYECIPVNKQMFEYLTLISENTKWFSICKEYGNKWCSCNGSVHGFRLTIDNIKTPGDIMLQQYQISILIQTFASKDVSNLIMSYLPE